MSKKKSSVPGLFVEGFKNKTFGAGLFVSPLCEPYRLFKRKNHGQNIYILPGNGFKYNGCIEVTPRDEVNIVLLKDEFAGRTVQKTEGDTVWDEDMKELRKEVEKFIQKSRTNNGEEWGKLDKIWEDFNNNRK